MAVKKEKLVERLTLLGIKFDPKDTVQDMRDRLSPETLADLEAEATMADTVSAMVLRDFWTAADEAGRVRAGSVISVTKDELIAGMERGTLARHAG